MNFSNQTVLVTGASRGIGRAVARLFAQQGARVAVHYNQDKRRAEQTLAELGGSGHVVLQANLMEADSARNLIDGVVQQMGGMDILVNNAGIFKEHPFADVSYEKWQEAWRETLAVNLLAPAHLLFCAAEHMCKTGGGKIVNISSRGAFRGEPDAPAYGASKAGLNALSQSMAKALAKHSIFVYAVAPGFVETDMAAHLLEGPEGDEIRNQSPLGRVAKPEEVARTVLFLASQCSEFLTGGIVDVNGASYLRS
ncbi:MAG: SDR family NAD(P)-dependent oxidoreductase [Acidiferrobacterales bacterium]